MRASLQSNVSDRERLPVPVPVPRKTEIAVDLDDVRSRFGQLLRHWRRLRSLSQLELAMRASTSPRHVSFIETGRSRPGRDLILRLAEVLDVPDRARGEWLGAAGLTRRAPPHATLDLPTLGSYRRAAAAMLALRTRVPAMIVGPAYRTIAVNDAATLVLPELAQAETIVDAFLAESMSQRLANPEAVLWGWYDRLLGDFSEDSSGDCQRLITRVERRLCGRSRPRAAGGEASVIRPVFRIDGQLVSTIGVTVHVRISRAVGAPSTMEAFYPFDAEAERYFANAITAER